MSETVWCVHAGHHGTTCEPCSRAKIKELEAKNAALEAQLQDALSHVAEVAQGITHYPHGKGEPCVRCERDELIGAVEQAKLEGARLALDAATKADCRFCDEPENYEAAVFDGYGWRHKTIGSAIAFVICRASAIRRLSPAAILKDGKPS